MSFVFWRESEVILLNVFWLELAFDQVADLFRSVGSERVKNIGPDPQTDLASARRLAASSRAPPAATRSFLFGIVHSIIVKVCATLSHCSEQVSIAGPPNQVLGRSTGLPAACLYGQRAV